MTSSSEEEVETVKSKGKETISNKRKHPRVEIEYETELQPPVKLKNVDF